MKQSNGRQTWSSGKSLRFYKKLHHGCMRRALGTPFFSFGVGQKLPQKHFYSCSPPPTQINISPKYVFTEIALNPSLDNPTRAQWKIFVSTNNFGILHESFGNQNWKDNILFSIIRVLLDLEQPRHWRWTVSI